MAPTISGGPYTSWDNYIRRLYEARGTIDKTTPGNQTLQAYYNNITETTGTTISSFSDTLLPQFDSLAHHRPKRPLRWRTI